MKKHKAYYTLAGKQRSKNLKNEFNSIAEKLKISTPYKGTKQDLVNAFALHNITLLHSVCRELTIITKETDGKYEDAEIATNRLINGYEIARVYQGYREREERNERLKMLMVFLIPALFFCMLTNITPLHPSIDYTTLYRQQPCTISNQEVVFSGTDEIETAVLKGKLNCSKDMTQEEISDYRASHSKDLLVVVTEENKDQLKNSGLDMLKSGTEIYASQNIIRDRFIKEKERLRDNESRIFRESSMARNLENLAYPAVSKLNPSTVDPIKTLNPKPQQDNNISFVLYDGNRVSQIINVY